MSFFGQKYKINNFNELSSLAENLRNKVIEKQIVLIEGVKDLSSEQFIDFASKVSGENSQEKNFISWDFGILMELKEDSSSPNYLFSNEKVPFHWDGAFHEVPNILVFNSLVTMQEGRTLFVDTQKIISDLSQEEVSILSNLEIVYSTEKLAHYGGEISQRVITKHPIVGNRVIRFGEEVLTQKNPVKRIIENSEHIKLIKELEQMLYDDKYCYAHEWSKGDILLADNFSLLHGRESFMRHGRKRHLRRLQIR